MSEQKIDQLNLGTMDAAVMLRAGRYTRNGSIDLVIEPEDQLAAGYYEAYARLTTEDLGRLLYWLRTGVALSRGEKRTPVPFAEQPVDQ